MPLFDTYVMVDWSASSERSKKPKKDAIWWAVHPLGDAGPWFKELDREKQRDGNDSVFYLGDGVQIYEQTRRTAIESIQKFLLHIARKRRVLIGFDFAFGYPHGFARRITRTDSAREVWRWMSERIIDTHENCNNRFAVAGELNREIVHQVNKEISVKEHRVSYGPFWGAPSARECVPLTNPYGQSQRSWPRTQFGFESKRLTDKMATDAKSMFQLHYTGSVGSQVLMGLPWLQYLIHLLRAEKETVGPCVVWPFDTGFSMQPKGRGPGIVIVEIYPSLLGRKKDVSPDYLQDKEIWDQAQVRLNAEAFALLDVEGWLERLFRIPEMAKDLSFRNVRTEEGWIFGIPYEKEIRRVLKKEYAGEGRRGRRIVET